MNYTTIFHLNDVKKLSEAYKCGTYINWLDCLRKVDPKELINHNTMHADLIFGTDVFPYTIDNVLNTDKFHTGIFRFFNLTFLGAFLMHST